MDHHNRQTLVNMRQEIKSFNENSIPISLFVANMTYLFHDIKNTSYNWDELFLKEMAILESVNYFVQSTPVEENVKEFITGEITNLEKLVKNRLLTYGVEITLEDIMQKYVDLIDDKITREDASNWAFSFMRLDDFDNLQYIPLEDEDSIQAELTTLYMIDFQHSQGEYEYFKNDFKEGLNRLKEL